MGGGVSVSDLRSTDVFFKSCQTCSNEVGRCE